MKVKVSFSGINDMLKFKNMGKIRRREIEKAPKVLQEKSYLINDLANTFHPKFQSLVVKKVINESRDCKTFVLVSKDGEVLAPFRAGQYLNVYVEVDGVKVSRAYTISSSPKEAREGEYRITVKAVNDGLVSNYLLGTLDVDEELLVSAPSGCLCYNSLRDENKIVAIAGGSGITPFYSLAQSIIDGDEDCLLTIFFGAKKEEDLIFLERFDDIVSKTNKVKIIYVLSEEKNAKYEYGLINKKLIDKYIDGANVSFFISGPVGMYEFLNKELAKYHLPNKFIRYENPPARSVASGVLYRIR